MGILQGKTILLTSGPTYAPLDAVRVITNRSSGRLGCAIAERCLEESATVLHLAGEGSASLLNEANAVNKAYYRVQRFGTVPELKALMRQALSQQKIDAVIMAAAVLDYIPENVESGKKRSQEYEWVVKFKRGEKLIEQIRSWSKDVLIVGFKLESQITLEELKARAENLMQRSDAEAVVANLMEEVASEHHTAYLIQRSTNKGITMSPPLRDRLTIAESLCQSMAERLNRNFL